MDPCVLGSKARGVKGKRLWPYSEELSGTERGKRENHGAFNTVSMLRPGDPHPSQTQEGTLVYLQPYDQKRSQPAPNHSPFKGAVKTGASTRLGGAGPSGTPSSAFLSIVLAGTAHLGSLPAS